MMNKYLKHYGPVVLLILSGLLTYALTGAETVAADTTGKDYKIGERLPATSTSAKHSSISYRALDWDELIPEDWDPMEALKGLDLSAMEDFDPRATEALEKVRAAWDDAPVVKKLNGARIEIPGFIVPLDSGQERIREFLLVPYYGACIHVPPPPSNQVLHVLLPKTLNKEQQQTLRSAALMYGAISVSGTLETVFTDTSMGFSGYRIKADRVDPYKLTENSGSTP